MRVCTMRSIPTFLLATMTIDYAFPLPQAVTDNAAAPPPLTDYAYTEFVLSLPANWSQITTPQANSFNWFSEQVGASITISVDFYEVHDAMAVALAEKNLAAREDGLQRSAPKPVTVIERSIKPHSGGVGQEMIFAAEVKGECFYLYMGYVTPRKIFNFTLVSQAEQAQAFALFNALMGSLRVNLP